MHIHTYMHTYILQGVLTGMNVDFGRKVGLEASLTGRMNPTPLQGLRIFASGSFCIGSSPAPGKKRMGSTTLPIQATKQAQKSLRSIPTSQDPPAEAEIQAPPRIDRCSARLEIPE